MKYVHQKCLEDWNISSNKSIKNIKENNKNFYSFSCELCHNDIKYQQVYKTGIFRSLFKLASRILNSFTNLFLFGFKMYLCFLLMKRSSIIIGKLRKNLSNYKNKKKLQNLFHYLWVLLSSGYIFDESYSFYRQMYLEERGIKKKFENRK
jgi:hypothetical protein